jgi:hypothetical protein
MIPSINAMKHVALLLRAEEAEMRLAGNRALRLMQNETRATEFFLAADDLNQVATHLEQQIDLRTVPEKSSEK